MSWLKNKLRQFYSVSNLEAISNYYFPFVIRLISVKSKNISSLVENQRKKYKSATKILLNLSLANTKLLLIGC